MVTSVAPRTQSNRQCQALEEMRSRRQQMYLERETVLKAPITAGEYREELRRQLEGSNAGLAGRAQHMRYFGRKRDGQVEPWLRAEEPLTLRDVAWLLGTDAVVDKIVNKVGDAAFEGAIETASRKSQLAEVDQRIEEVELQEEREILRLNAAGVMARRRETADPRILLQVWMEGFEVPEPVRREPPPEPTPLERAHGERADLPILPARERE